MILAALALVAPMLIPAIGRTQSTAIGTRTVEGLVRDIACPLQKKNSTSTSFGQQCVIDCAKAGSPLGILTDDGTIYVPVTETMPDTGQNKLKPFIAEHVRATGKIFERNGTLAIEITEIHQIPGAAGK